MNLEHLKGKRLLVTGGTGFVGRHFIAALAPLAEQGHMEVSCLVRASSRRDMLPSFVKFFEADLQTGQGLDAALQGQDMLVHGAALLFGTHWQQYMSNVQAASLLGKAVAKAQQQGAVERVVFISSLAASGPSATAPGVGDDVQAQPLSAYGWSKYLAEEALGRHCGQSLVTLRPPMLYGPEDKGLLPYFVAAQKGLVVSPGFGRDFPVSIMHVQDVAQAILCALQSQAQGVYHCNDGAVHTLQSVGALMAELMGKKALCLRMPLSILAVSAALSTVWGALSQPFGLRAPSWNMDKYRESKAVGWLCDSTRLQQELAFVPSMPLRQGLQETIASYKKSGLLA